MHFELHAKLHDLLVFGNNLVLCLLKFEVSISDLSFIVLDLDLDLIVDTLHLCHLRGVLVREACQMGLKLFDKFLFVAQLILDHVEFLKVLLLSCVVLGGYFQFDIFLL